MVGTLYFGKRKGLELFSCAGIANDLPLVGGGSLLYKYFQLDPDKGIQLFNPQHILYTRLHFSYQDAFYNGYVRYQYAIDEVGRRGYVASAILVKQGELDPHVILEALEQMGLHAQNSVDYEGNSFKILAPPKVDPHLTDFLKGQARFQRQTPIVKNKLGIVHVDTNQSFRDISLQILQAASGLLASVNKVFWGNLPGEWDQVPRASARFFDFSAIATNNPPRIPEYNPGIQKERQETNLQAAHEKEVKKLLLENQQLRQANKQVEARLNKEREASLREKEVLQLLIEKLSTEQSQNPPIQGREVEVFASSRQLVRDSLHIAATLSVILLCSSLLYIGMVNPTKESLPKDLSSLVIPVKDSVEFPNTYSQSIVKIPLDTIFEENREALEPGGDTTDLGQELAEIGTLEVNQRMDSLLRAYEASSIEFDTTFSYKDLNQLLLDIEGFTRGS